MQLYKITNLYNNKCYIGITRRTFRERYNHRDDWWNAPSINKPLQNAVKKYGEINFKVEILLETFNLEFLNQQEIYFIKLYNSFAPNGYNLTTGGEHNYYVSEESKLKNSLAKRGKPSHNKGKKASDITRKRLSESQKRRFLNSSTWNKGLKTGRPSEQAIKNSAEAHKKAVAQLNNNDELIQIFNGLIDAKSKGFSPSCISLCCKKKIKTHKGYKWVYLNEYAESN